jgi:hypothetical protein
MVWKYFARNLACLFMIACGADANGQHTGHGAHPPMPDARFCARVRAINAVSSDSSNVALELRSVSVAAELNQPIVVPESQASFRVVQYLPSTELEQTVAADESGQASPAIELAVEGPTQSMRRWLVADDPERNRLISYIATWRFMAVKDAARRDALLEQFRTELTRVPAIRIASSDRENWHGLPLDVGRTQDVPELGCAVTVRQFVPDYATDRTTLTASSKSERMKNPAALVDIEHQGIKEAKWVFAKFPGFSEADRQLPFRVILDSPIETDGRVPDIAVVAVGNSHHETWIRKDGETTSTPLCINSQQAIPGSQYALRIVQHVTSARLVETYRPVSHGKGRPAIEIEYPDEKGNAARAWLGMGHSRRLATQGGAIVVGLDDCTSTPSKGHP